MQMEFGSEEVFQYIKDNLFYLDCDNWYERVYAVIKADTMVLLRNDKLSLADKEEIVQTVEMKIFKDLVDFVMNEKSSSEASRNAYLKSIVKNTKINFFRLGYNKNEETFDYDSLVFSSNTSSKTPEDNVINQECFSENVKELFDGIIEVCSINTTPDKIISFLLCKVYVSLEISRKNGNPQEVFEMLNGKSIDKALFEVKKKIQSVLDVTVPNGIYSELDEKVENVMNGNDETRKVFQLSVRTITDSSNWIGKKIKNKKEKKS